LLKKPSRPPHRAPNHAGSAGKSELSRASSVRWQAQRQGAQVGVPERAREEVFEQNGLDQMLGSEKLPRADFGDTHFPLHAGQPLLGDARGVRARGWRGRAGKGQVNPDLQAPLGVGKGAVKGCLAVEDGFLRALSRKRDNHLK